LTCLTNGWSFPGRRRRRGSVTAVGSIFVPFNRSSLGLPAIGTILGAVVGVAFIAMTRALLGQTLDAHIGNLRGARGMTALLVIGIMTVHSLTEGVALGVSFAGEESLGILIAIAISIHNIPEGVAVSLALVPSGRVPAAPPSEANALASLPCTGPPSTQGPKINPAIGLSA
jgi:zinc transporter ZupT